MSILPLSGLCIHVFDLLMFFLLRFSTVRLFYIKMFSPSVLPNSVLPNFVLTVSAPLLFRRFWLSVARIVNPRTTTK
jgi:hypothetical protein